jgi:Sulfotransferase family
MAERIRITDLREPVLTDTQRFAIDYGETLSISLTVDAVLSAAVARTGLDDFGPDDFVARLQRWLSEVDDDPNRHGIGRLSLFNACVRYAANRLLALHPEIHDIEIVKPIIVVGLPRTGTTHLLNLLSADDRLRSLPLWESYEPVPRRGEGPGAHGIDPRFVRCATEWEQMQMVTPHVAAMHPMNPDHVHEEIELMLSDFASYNLEWVARVPGWRDHYLATDQTPHYAWMHTLLKVLTWMRPRDRWVLKSPQHFEQLGPLMATFPDATVVMTHRDPVSVVQSAATMMTYAARMSYRTVDPDWYIDYWTDRVDRLLTAAVRDIDLVPAAQRFDVHFDEFMADDIAMVERIFDFAGHPMTKAARRQLDHHMATHERGRFGQVVYDLRNDFHVEPAAVRERFDGYLAMFNVPIEVR